MPGRDLEQLYRVALNLGGDEVREALGDVELSETDLDRHLPQARDAQEPFVVGLLDELAGMSGERRAAGDEPQEGVGVEEQPQGA